jgi:hypothetical protein
MKTGEVWQRGTSKMTLVREYVKYPVETEDDLERLVLLDPDYPEKYEDLEESLKHVTEYKGFIPTKTVSRIRRLTHCLLKFPT